MKLWALLIGILLLSACGTSEEPTPTSTELELAYTLFVGDKDISVRNDGDLIAEEVILKFDISWYNSVFNGSKESHDQVSWGHYERILPGEETVLTDLRTCVPDQQEAKGAFNIYKCEITLFADGSKQDKDIIYTYFGKGEVEGLFDFYQLSEADYLGVRDYAAAEYERLKAEGKI